MENKSTNIILDIFKYIFSFIVVAIHIKPFVFVKNEYILNFFDSISLLAVPFFLICTGYFISRKSDITSYIKSLLKRNIEIYIKFTIIYLPFTIYFYLINKNGFLMNLIDFVRGLFFIGEHYNSWILWYILSLIYSLTIIYFLKKKNFNFYSIFFIGIFFYIIGVGVDVIINNISLGLISVLLKKVFESGRIFKSLLYLSFGIVCSDLKNRFSFNKIIYIISFTIMICINTLFNGLIDIFLVPLSVFSLFLFLICIDEKCTFTFNSIFLRKISTNLYFWHLYIWGIISLVVYRDFKYGMIMYLVTIFIIHILFFITRKKIVYKFVYYNV